MVFSSLSFLYVFLPLSLIAYYLTPRSLKNLTILLSGLIFYAWGEPKYVIVLLISTLIDYCAGIVIYKNQEHPLVRRIALITSIIMNLSLLGVFKYSGFFITNINNVFGLSLNIPDLILPIGISFFTFQSMSYTIDVYMGKIPVQKNPISFAAFVTLFPQIVAGPIVRYSDVVEDIDNKKLSGDNVAEGIKQFITGLGKKVLIANNIGALWKIVKAMEYSELSVLLAWIGIIAFSLQIYFDFSGYSDMAVGLGKMLGFNFPKNFNYPYISTSISEFWRRWHITLSEWFKSYVYIPLGGNKKTKARTFINLLTVWFLTGFWHGAKWNFIIWGLYFGIIIIIEKAFLGKLLEKLPKLLSWLYSIILIIIGWVIFEMNNVNAIFSYLKAMFGGNGLLLDNTAIYLLQNYIIIFIIAIIGATTIIKRLAVSFERKNSKIYEYTVPFVKIGILLVATVYLVNSTYNPFLYFNF